MTYREAERLLKTILLEGGRDPRIPLAGLWLMPHQMAWAIAGSNTHTGLPVLIEDHAGYEALRRAAGVRA